MAGPVDVGGGEPALGAPLAPAPRSSPWCRARGSGSSSCPNASPRRAVVPQRVAAASPTDIRPAGRRAGPRPGTGLGPAIQPSVARCRAGRRPAGALRASGESSVAPAGASDLAAEAARVLVGEDPLAASLPASGRPPAADREAPPGTSRNVGRGRVAGRLQASATVDPDELARRCRGAPRRRPSRSSRPTAWTCAGVPRGASHASRSHACQSSAPSSDATHRLTTPGSELARTAARTSAESSSRARSTPGATDRASTGAGVGGQRGVDVAGGEQLAHEVARRCAAARSAGTGGTR